jgi:hypothetical protein
LLERPEPEGATVWLREEEEFVPLLGATRVRLVVVVEVPVDEAERRLLVVPSVYRGEEELRPLFTDEELEELRPVLLPLKEDERPLEEE